MPICQNTMALCLDFQFVKRQSIVKEKKLDLSILWFRAKWPRKDCLHKDIYPFWGGMGSSLGPSHPLCGSDAINLVELVEIINFSKIMFESLSSINP